MGGRRYTKEQLTWIKENLNNYVNYIEMTKDFNKKFYEKRTEQGISNTATKRLGLNKINNSGQYSSSYKKEELPIGTIRESGNKTTYIKVKLVGKKSAKFSGYKEPYWLPLQKKIYQDKYGEIKEDEMIIFLDCNNQNYNIENLYCINRKISAILASNHWYSKNPTITLLGITYAKLILELKDCKNSRRKHEKIISCL